MNLFRYKALNKLLLIAAVIVAANACPCNHVQVLASRLNYRTGPYPARVLGVVPRGRCLPYRGRCNQNWYRVYVHPHTACVSPSSKYTRYTGGCSGCACNHVKVLASGLHIRKYATNGPSLGVARHNTCLPYKGRCSSNWYKVQFNQHIGCTSNNPKYSKPYCLSEPKPPPRRCFGGMCANKKNVQRRCDPSGCGHYGARRGSRTHRGSDVVCYGGNSVTAPFNGRVSRTARPYGDRSCVDNGFVFVSTDPSFPGISVKVFYANGYSVGAHVSRGGYIARHIDLQCWYSYSMTDHIHVEVYKNNVRVNPTSYLYC